MIGILLLSHGPFCEQLMTSTAMIAGPLANTKAVALHEGEDPDVFGKCIQAAVKTLDADDGILVLVDILGGTPFNQIALLSRELNVQIVTGMNMPMFLQVLLERDKVESVTELAELAKSSGLESIKMITGSNSMAE